MRYKKQKSGLGIVAAIIIIAAAGLGGYVVYESQIKVKSGIIIETQELV
jgi:hypothetical protein